MEKRSRTTIGARDRLRVVLPTSQRRMPGNRPDGSVGAIVTVPRVEEPGRKEVPATSGAGLRKIRTRTVHAMGRVAEVRFVVEEMTVVRFVVESVGRIVIEKIVVQFAVDHRPELAVRMIAIVVVVRVAREEHHAVELVMIVVDSIAIVVTIVDPVRLVAIAIIRGAVDPLRIEMTTGVLRWRVKKEVPVVEHAKVAGVPLPASRTHPSQGKSVPRVSSVPRRKMYPHAAPVPMRTDGRMSSIARMTNLPARGPKLPLSD